FRLKPRLDQSVFYPCSIRGSIETSAQDALAVGVEPGFDLRQQKLDGLRWRGRRRFEVPHPVAAVRQANICRAAKQLAALAPRLQPIMRGAQFLQPSLAAGESVGR